VLMSAELRAHAWKVIQSHRLLTALSLGLVALMATGCAQHACSEYGTDALLPPLLWIPIAAFTLNRKSGSHHALFIILCTAVAGLSILVMWQFFLDGKPRPRGLSFNVLTGPMIMAMMCLLGALYAQLSAVRSKFKLIFRAVMTIVLAGTICTQSRTSLLSFIVAAVVFLLCTPKAERAKLALFIVPLIILWAFSQTNRYQEGQREIANLRLGQHYSSFGERTDAYRWGREHILDAPWFGKGAIAIQKEFKQRGRDWGRNVHSYPLLHHLHNDYLQLAISHGLPAMACFITFWLAFSRQLLMLHRKLATSLSSPAITGWLLAMMVIYMSAFMTDSFTYWVFTWGTVMACFGVAVGLVTPLNVASGHPSNASGQ
jgi:O-antigen ligase